MFRGFKLRVPEIQRVSKQATNRTFCHKIMKDPWAGVEVTNLEGEKVLLAEQWKDKRVVLFLVRRFG